MKKVKRVLAGSALLVLTANPPALFAQSAQRVAKTSYQNPLPVEFGDPYVLHVKNDKYYMYGTGGVAKNGFAAYSSTDLVNWKSEGQVYFAGNKNGWSDSTAEWNGAYWAPEVYERNGKFYMFYSSQWKDNPGNEVENFRIGVAVSDKPTGPFIDIKNRPIFDPGYPIIDANVLFDANGKVYLYYSRCCYKHPVESEIADWAKQKGWFNEIEESWVYGVELKPDFSGVTGEPVLLLRPPVKMDDKQAEWESRSVTSKEVNRRWTEGSVAFKKANTYYMMYSANYFGGKNYAVGYATSTNPLGPFTKATDNPVLQKNVEQGGVVTGTGHNSVTYSPDGKEMFCVYHGRTLSTGDKRVVFIDRMKILNSGKLVVEGPTTKPQPVPSGVKYTIMGDIEQVILDFREAVLDADSTQLDKLLSENLSYGHSDGHVEGKTDLINKLADGTYQFVTMDLSHQTIRMTGDIAIVRHELDAKTNDEGKPGEAHLFVLLVWQKRLQEWQLVARQAVKKRQ